MIDFLSASKKGCVQQPSTEKEDKTKEGLRQTATDWPVRMRYHESMMFIAACVYMHMYAGSTYLQMGTDNSIRESCSEGKIETIPPVESGANAKSNR